MQTEQPDFKPVYIFGAGASKMIGGPLLNDFLSVARTFRYERDFPAFLKSDFDKVFGYQAELMKTKAFLGSDFDNLETLFSMLDMEWSVEATRNTGKYGELNGIRTSFVILVTEILRHFVGKEENSWQKYRSLIRYMAKPMLSTFITLNYDLAIDKALFTHPFDEGDRMRYIVDYGVGNKGVQDVFRTRKVLKLHGSANWHYCKNCEHFTAFGDYFTPSDSTYNEDFHKDQSCKRNECVVNVIIPPTWNKVNQAKEIAITWYNAIQELAHATHIVIVGYSFPRTDVFFDQLLGLSLRDSKNLRRIYVIDPSSKVERTLQDFFEQHFRERCVTFIPTTLEEASGVIQTKVFDKRNGFEACFEELSEKFRSR